MSARAKRPQLRAASNSRVAEFRPSTNGFRFTNTFAADPVVTVRLPFTHWRIGQAANGLCGGMVFAARDYFEASRPVPDTATPPAHGTPLFRYLVRRLIAAFNLPDAVLRYLYWMLLPDEAVRRRTLERQWPGVRACIDAGHPCPLGLVTIRSWHPLDLRHNHVVLAYGYRIASGVLSVDVYDPNTAQSAAEDAHLEMPLTASPITHNIDLANPIRGFFQLRYRRREPPY